MTFEAQNHRLRPSSGFSGPAFVDLPHTYIASHRTPWTLTACCLPSVLSPQHGVHSILDSRLTVHIRSVRCSSSSRAESGMLLMMR